MVRPPALGPLSAVALLAVLGLVGVRATRASAVPIDPETPEAVRLGLSLPDVAHTEVVPDPGAHTFTFRLEYEDGRHEELTADEFAALSYWSQTDRRWWELLLNVTSPLGVAWVAVGLLGQVLFTGRMVVQWIASEREHRSVVPVAFWWMSLGGATMLLVYFLWRQDIVGVLGQGTGWLIYGRNLWLIHRPGAAQPA